MTVSNSNRDARDQRPTEARAPSVSPGLRRELLTSGTNADLVRYALEHGLLTAR